MKKVFLIVGLLSFASNFSVAQNYILNPDLETGSIPTLEGQLNYATGWTKKSAACGFSDSPDLFDIRSTNCRVDIPANKWAYNTTVRASGNRYVGFSGSEDIWGSINSLSSSCPTYVLQFYVHTIDNYASLSIPCAPVNAAPYLNSKVEVRLVNSATCASTLVYSSPTINPSASWQFLTTNFTLTAAQLAAGYNKVEFKIVAPTGYATGQILFMDDFSLTTQPLTPYLSGPAGTICQGDPLTFYGFATSGTPLNHFWEIASCDAQGNYTGQVWNSWFAGTPGSITFGHFIGFIPVCGNYYRIKLALNNGCVDWVETTTIIFIECPPKVITETPEPVCEGTSVTLSVSGDADDYEWLPGNIHNTSIVVTPSATTTYTVIGTGANGCSISVPITVTVYPANIDIDLSTGLDNTGTLILPGNDDDTWKVRGVPGTIYTSAFSALTPTKVVSPLAGVWVSSPNENWITVPTAIADDGTPIEVYGMDSDNTPEHDNYHWFETEFTLPSNLYSNLRIEGNESAVDNQLYLYLNSQALTGTSNNGIYALPTWGPSNFNTLHYPGTFATYQPLYQSGTNTILAKVPSNGISYLGLLLNIHVIGECVRGRSMIISDDEFKNERIAATTYLYPNPSAGNFTISCDNEIISSVIVKDALGRIVKDVQNVISKSVNISLENENKGFYFVEIIFVGQSKPVYKKMILE